MGCGRAATGTTARSSGQGNRARDSRQQTSPRLLQYRAQTLGQGLSALSGRTRARDTYDVSCTLHATDRSVTSAAPGDGPAFAVAVTDAPYGTVRVHLIGWLEASTAKIRTDSFSALLDNPGEQDVVLDLSTHLRRPHRDERPRGEPGAARHLGPDGQFRASTRGGPPPAGLRSPRSPGGLGATAAGVHQHPALDAKAAREGASVPMTARHAKNNSTRSV